MVRQHKCRLENRLARRFADMEAVYTHEGSNEINPLVAGRDLTGVRRSKSL